ncbi:hypothetical protein PIROE2DRAFT_7806 [Piromyces sp. E2]|nr:hypothetical protein PIROE2DRAFT_7806 [Piromyces sp. E2]|eukprot:OUM65183.1 hypothetical protein PIROE2DRAFT_7806 [Piromyces sp. E2]
MYNNDNNNYTLDIKSKYNVNEPFKIQTTYNNTSHLFNNFEDFTRQMFGAKDVEICNTEYINIKDKISLLIWIPTYYVNIMAVFFNVYPEWDNIQRNNGKKFCMRIKDVGWVDNANKVICKSGNYDDGTPIECPDSIVLGTTQFSYRYNNNETLNLERYFREYLKKNGHSIESSINKYSLYDYHFGNNWLAVPLIVDFRNLVFNSTTFDYCKSKGFNIYYPPVNN